MSNDTSNRARKAILRGERHIWTRYTALIEVKRSAPHLFASAVGLSASELLACVSHYVCGLYRIGGEVRPFHKMDMAKLSTLIRQHAAQ